MEVDDPLFDQEMVALLSLAIHKVCSRVSRTQPVTTALWATMPANYKSELEMLPVLCFAVIKDEDTVGAEGARHITVARPSGKSQTPHAHHATLARIAGTNGDWGLGGEFIQAGGTADQGIHEEAKIHCCDVDVPVEADPASVALAECVLQCREESSRARQRLPMVVSVWGPWDAGDVAPTASR